YKNADVWLLKTDNSGDTLWTKTYDGGDADLGYAVQNTSDGGFIIVGTTRSFGSGGFDFFLIKTDSSGDTTWTKTYGGSNDERAYSVMQTSDDGYIIVGETTSFGNGNDDAWLVRTNSIGDTLWTKSFGGAESDEGHSVIQTSDGGFVIAGVKESSVTYDDMWLIKTNSSGEMLWEKTYDYGVGDNEEGNSVVQTSDGGFAICGLGTNISGFSEDILIIRTDELGDTLWTIAYGDSSYDVGNSIIQSSDGGYVVAGTEESFLSWTNFLLMKIESDLLPSVDEKFIPSEFSLSQNFPNPFNPNTIIKYQIPEISFITLKVFDVVGNEVVTLVNEELSAGEYEVEFDGSGLSSGIYFYQLKAGNFIQTKKMILLK
ncbi:MAG: T9SS type A sorting domain-containing protein, partial [Ignavibacteria bacterium]|nr:T9SS type A sorting domain-containing protein [Ignavibacteria bacterium]